MDTLKDKAPPIPLVLLQQAGVLHTSKQNLATREGWRMSDFGTQTGREVQHLQTRYDQRCLNVEENGNVYMSVCQALDRQMFYFEGSHIKSLASDKCLDYDHFNGNVHMYACHEHDNQKWYFRGESLRTMWDDKCMDYNYNTQNVYMWWCHGGSNQKWFFSESFLTVTSTTVLVSGSTTTTSLDTTTTAITEATTTTTSTASATASTTTSTTTTTTTTSTNATTTTIATFTSTAIPAADTTTTFILNASTTRGIDDGTPAKELPIFDRPICNDGAVPQVEGHLAWNSHWVLDAGCRYEVWDARATTTCLSGSWVVLQGASNGLLMFHTLLMMLTAPSTNRVRSGRFGGRAVIDVFIQDGQILEYSALPSVGNPCEEVKHGIMGAADNCRQHVLKHWAGLPEHAPDVLRITIFCWWFWDTTPLILDLVEADQHWKDADVAMVVQVSAWYTICNYIKTHECPRQDLLECSEDDVVRSFNSEMQSALERLKPFCSARARRHGCVVGTKSWSAAGGGLGASFARFDELVRQRMTDLDGPTRLRMFDFYKFGAGMPEQTILGHGSQILHSWAWQIMLNGFCPRDAAMKVSGLTFSGPLCSAAEVDLEKCPEYADLCRKWGRCTTWMCMNSIPCQLLPFDLRTFNSAATIQSSSGAWIQRAE